MLPIAHLKDGRPRCLWDVFKSGDAVSKNLTPGRGFPHGKTPSKLTPMSNIIGREYFGRFSGTASTKTRLTRTLTPASDALTSSAARFLSAGSPPSLRANPVRVAFSLFCFGHSFNL